MYTSIERERERDNRKSINRFSSSMASKSHVSGYMSHVGSVIVSVKSWHPAVVDVLKFLEGLYADMK